MIYSELKYAGRNQDGSMVPADIQDYFLGNIGLRRGDSAYTERRRRLY